MQRNGNPRVSVVVPTRNEARNLEVVLPAIAAVRPRVHEIIVVDGNSVDGTIETAQRVLSWVKVTTQTRKGKGNAMACGFEAASGDVIVMFDADGSADPAEIPAFVRALIDGADFAKGSRFIRGGGSDDITLLRKSGNAGLNGVANALFGTSYTDLCYGYNAFWRDILPVLDLPPTDLPAPPEGMVWGDGFEIETVLNCRVAAAGLKITEVPSMERERIFGQSNLRTFADGTRVLRTLAAERRRAQRKRVERVHVEEQSRALTPAGGIPMVPPPPPPSSPQPPPPGASAPPPAPAASAVAGNHGAGSVHAPGSHGAPSPHGASITNGSPVANGANAANATAANATVTGAAAAGAAAGVTPSGAAAPDAASRPVPQPRAVAPEPPRREGPTVHLALEEEAS